MCSDLLSKAENKDIITHHIVKFEISIANICVCMNIFCLTVVTDVNKF